jgi:hypothetical protein
MSNTKVSDNLFYNSYPITYGFTSGMIHFKSEGGGGGFDGIDIYNNILFNPDAKSADISNKYGYIKNMNVYNNTTYSPGGATTWAFSSASGTPESWVNFRFVNNIVMAAGTGNMIQVPLASQMSGDIVIDYNNYYTLAPKPFYEVDGILKRQSQRSWDYWKTTLGYDTHSSPTIKSNPLFVDATVGDNFNLRLQPESPCKDTGTVGPGIDFAGTLRPQGAAWDMGAYEFTIREPLQQLPLPPSNLRIQ